MSPPSENPTKYPYRKLPGDFRGFFRRNSLWMGNDHLLLVDSSRFSETYKRFYLRDIQTIIIRRTPRFVIPYYWVLLALAATIALLIGLNPTRTSYFWTAVVMLAAVAVYLYIASMFQSCTCHLITRVNKVQLPSLFRVSAARRFVEVVTPQLIAAQGQLPADWVERSTSLEELSTAADRNPDAPVDLLPDREFSWVTVLVFALVLADAGVTWMQLRTNNSGTLATPSILNMVLVAICATISIVRLSRTKGGGPLRMLVLAGLLVVAAATYGSVLLESFDQQFFHHRYDNLLDYPGMRPLGLAEILADFAVAIPGLILAFRQSSTAKPAISFANPGADTSREAPKL